MSKISTKINLTQFHHTLMNLRGKNGMVECIVLPVDANYFFRGEKGIYMNLIGYELKEKRVNQTHIVKQEFPREVFEKFTDQERDAFPIVGGHNVWEFKEPDPLTIDLKLSADENNNVNDLPF